MTTINTIDTETGNITTDGIRNLWDLGEALFAVFGAQADPEIVEDVTDADGDVDYERYLGWMTEDLGEFVNQRENHGRVSADGWTWDRSKFSDDDWARVEALYPATA